MACFLRRFFGLHIADESVESIHDHWGKVPDRAGALLLLDHIELWRVIRRRRWRAFAAGSTVRVFPVGRAAAFQVRTATGCRTGTAMELQVLVRVLAQAEQANAAIYLIHARQEMLRGMEQNIRATFPGLRVVGRAAFHPGRRDSIRAAVRKAAPSFLIVADARRPLLDWVVTFSGTFTGCLTIVSPGAGARMSGRRRGPRFSSILGFPARLLLGPVLFAHRLALARRTRHARA